MQMARLHRWLRRTRVCVLGLVAVALTLQPVLAAAGELHELMHDPSGGHAHAMHSAGVANELTAVDEPLPDAEVLHTLLHFAHCAGVDTTVVPVVAGPIAIPRRGYPAVAHAVTPPNTRLPAPFKPPIDA